MTRETVLSSSNIKSVGYDSLALLLEVEFKGGAAYTYRNVTAARHAKLMAAKSKGKDLQEITRNPALYPCECIVPVRIFK